MYGAHDCHESGVNEVFALMTSTSAWVMINADDDALREQIDDAYSEIAHYDDATIRAAMEMYVQCCHGVRVCDSVHVFSIYNMMVLNRFVFNVPNCISRENFEKLPFYFGKGGPEVDIGINLLWPLVLKENGKVALKAMFYANGGPEPDPLEEFDVFENAFGRRVPVREN
jgi:hypothetical protein